MLRTERETRFATPVAVLAAACVLLAGLSALADVPDYEGEFFTDLSDTLSSRQKVEISRALRVGAQASRIHPMLVVIDQMSDYPDLPQDIGKFATELANSWKIGDHETKKGILALFSLQDRKFFIARTANVEQRVTDSIQKSMMSRVASSLKSGEVPRAMLLAAQNIAENLPAASSRTSSSGKASGGAAAPTKTVTRTTRTRHYTGRSRRYRSGGTTFGSIIGLLFFAIFFMAIFSMLSGGRHGYGRGYGGYHGDYGGDFTETTTTESWTEGGGFDSGGGFDVGGFDSFGGGDFDGGGSFGEW